MKITAMKTKAHTQGYVSIDDFGKVDAMLANMKNGTFTASQQRLIAKQLPGVGNQSRASYREMLQSLIGQFLDINPMETSVIATTSGTAALRAVLKSVHWDPGSEVIVPMTTVGATVEALIEEKFVPVFISIDRDSWLLPSDATEHAINERMVATITVDWLGTQCALKTL